MRLEGSVVNENIYFTELLYGLLHGSLTKIGIGNVTGNNDGPPAFCFHILLSLFCVFMFGQVHDRDICAFSGKQDRHGAPDAGVATTARAMLGSLQNAMGGNRWNDLLLDLDGGPILLTPVGDQILQVAFDDVASLGRVRFSVKRVSSKLAG